MHFRIQYAVNPLPKSDADDRALKHRRRRINTRVRLRAKYREIRLTHRLHGLI